MVHASTVTFGMKFPYDVNDLQSQAVAEINTNDADQYAAVDEAPANPGSVSTLDSEVLAWQRGNTLYIL